MHLHVNDQFFNLVVTPGLIQSDESATQHGQAHTHHLPRAKVAVSVGGTLYQLFKRLPVGFLPFSDVRGQKTEV